MKTPWTVVFCFAFISCASGGTAIAEDLSPEKLVQLAQEESDNNRYSAAERYYNAILERFPDDKTAVCGARYEIAFIHYKQKNYSLAEEEFDAVINSYDEPDGDLLPQKYFILSNIVLDNIRKERLKK
jgi:outer membrane protein assembly factor BamD (BamD/ComL family)